jgi:hypothetical protein
MNKDYLDKVVYQLVGESIIDGRIVWVPYSVHHAISPMIPSFHSPTYSLFSSYVRNIYGLTGEEIKYVWEQYTVIINSRI